VTKVHDLFLKTAFDLACRAGPTLDTVGESSALLFPFTMSVFAACIILVVGGRKSGHTYVCIARRHGPSGASGTGLHSDLVMGEVSPWLRLSRCHGSRRINLKAPGLKECDI
jgi:hypothetical protein